MAYTQAPTVSVYQTKTIPLMQAWQQREKVTDFDVINKNVVWDIIQNQATGESYLEAIKRYGYDQLVVADPPGDQIYAFYNWDSQGLLVVVGAFGIRVYNGNGLLIITNATSFADKHIGFTQFLYDSGAVTLIMTDGIALYEMTTTGTVTAITDPDRPLNHLPYPVFLDGYLFLATTDGNIQNSSLNDPKVWAAGDFISVESYPDGLRAIGRVGQYIAAFGETSIQFYYDATNPTGTPLAAQTTVLQIGFRGGFTYHKEEIIFIGVGNNTKATIYSLSGLKATPIIDSTLIRSLESGPNILSANFLREGNILNINGHSFYTWADKNGTTGVAAIQRTYMVDLESGLFTTTGGFFSSITPDDDYLPIRSAATFYMFGQYTTIFAPFSSLVTDNRKMYNFDPSYVQDTGLDIEVIIQTKLEDFGTKRQKFCSRLLLDCDKASNTALCKMELLINDNALTGILQNVDLFTTYPVVYGLGRFRTLQVRMTFTAAVKMRFRGVEVDYIQGDM